MGIMELALWLLTSRHAQSAVTVHLIYRAATAGFVAMPALNRPLEMAPRSRNPAKVIVPLTDAHPRKKLSRPAMEKVSEMPVNSLPKEAQRRASAKRCRTNWLARHNASGLVKVKRVEKKPLAGTLKGRGLRTTSNRPYQTGRRG